MGEHARQVERTAAEALGQVLGSHFHFLRGHELRAGAFISLKRNEDGPSGSGSKVGKWLPLQIKSTTARSPTWSRKIRHILRNKKTELHGVVLIGISLLESDDVFMHLVHKHHDYQRFDVSSPMWNCKRSDLVTSLSSVWDSGFSVLHRNPGRSFVYSPATLVENEARADFYSMLEGSGVHYQAARNEFDSIDGSLFLIHAPEHKFAIQEKVLAWRRENGEALGLRCTLRRASGHNYAAGDFEYLLLHARENEPGTGAATRIAGCAFLPASELSAHGYLRGDGSPGCGIISIYPEGVPGVRSGRDGWAEKHSHRRENVATEIRNELERRVRQIERQQAAGTAETTDESSCSIQ
mmetsp:Transcript_17021/g.42169  ORF Transcript_17021/g.42169 Transcript_17021/m.42169 type:complete len:353 (+) Transcript_17021:101-1159(+)